MIRLIFRSWLIATFTTVVTTAYSLEQIQVRDFVAALEPFGKQQEVTTRCDEYMRSLNDLNGLTLYVAAAHCSREAKLIESTVLLSAADVRFSVESNAFPPTAVDFGAWNQARLLRSLSMSVMGKDSVFRDKKMIAQVMSKFKDWQPNLSALNAPGWVYATNAQSNFTTQLQAMKDERLNQLMGHSIYLQDDELYQAKVNWKIALANTQRARTSLKGSSNQLATITIASMEKFEQELLSKYETQLARVGDRVRGEAPALIGSIRASDLFNLNPETLQVQDEMGATILIVPETDRMYSIQYEFDGRNANMLNPDVVHFLTFCLASSITYKERHYYAWSFTMPDENAQRAFPDKVKILVLLLNKDDVPGAVSGMEDLRWSEAISQFKQSSCKFIRPKYLWN